MDNYLGTFYGYYPEETRARFVCVTKEELKKTSEELEALIDDADLLFADMDSEEADFNKVAEMARTAKRKNKYIVGLISEGRYKSIKEKADGLRSKLNGIMVIADDAALDYKEIKDKVLAGIDACVNESGIINLDFADYVQLMEATAVVYAMHVTDRPYTIAERIKKRLADLGNRCDIEVVKTMLLHMYQYVENISLSEMVEIVEDVRSEYPYDMDVIFGAGCLSEEREEIDATVLIGV